MTRVGVVSECVAAAATGVEAISMQSLFSIYRGPATTLATRICGAVLAEDVVQEAFFSIWRSSSTYCADRGEMSAWVLGAVRNRAIDALRRDTRHSQQRASAEAYESVPDPALTHAIVIARDEAFTLRSMLAALPCDQARVIELAYLEGLTHVEISDLLSLSLGTVKGRIRLGLAKLRSCEAGLGTGARGHASRQPGILDATNASRLQPAA